MSRTEFSARTKKAAWDRAKGICECGCDQPFGNHPKSRPHYDHDMPDALGGDTSLENCKVLRVDCHRAKTANRDTRPITKALRGERARRNIEAPKAIIPGSKASKFKRKIGGGTVLR